MRRTHLLEGNPIGRSVLLVEDDMIVAMDAEGILRSLGATEVHTAASVRKALRIIDERVVDLAILDVSLGTETSEQVAHRLHERGTPFVLATGYAPGDIDAKYPSAPVINKPYTPADLGRAIASLLATDQT